MNSPYLTIDGVQYRIHTQTFLNSLRYISKVELERLCMESGMSDREIQGILAYVYDRKSAEEVANSLNLSISLYHQRKNCLAYRFYNYLKSIKYKLVAEDKILVPVDSEK